MNKKGEFIAIRPDPIIEARFDLTAKQNDILDMVFSQVDDDNNYDYILDVAKYKELYNMDTSNIYRDLEKHANSMEGKGFRLYDKDNPKDNTFYPWFSKIHYIPNAGTIEVRLDKDVKEMFILVKKKIYYHIKYTLNFKSVYSKRFYFYLKSFEDTGWRLDEVEVLKAKLQCPASYKNYADFRRFALQPAFEEINGNSDISFEFKEKKKGRKVTHLEFFISNNRRSADEEITSDKIDKPKNKKKVDNFNNFEQREYDYDALEKRLLGWDK